MARWTLIATGGIQGSREDILNRCSQVDSHDLILSAKSERLKRIISGRGFQPSSHLLVFHGRAYLGSYLVIVPNFREEMETQPLLHATSTTSALSSIALCNECFNQTADFGVSHQTWGHIQ